MLKIKRFIKIIIIFLIIVVFSSISKVLAKGNYIELQFADNNFNDTISELPHYDEQGVAYVTYDDFNAIKNTHIFANEYGYEVRATEGKEYHIYKYNESPVTVKTNVNWENATFIIHDENIEQVSGKYESIFNFTNTQSQDVVTIDNDISFTINTRTKNISEIKAKLEEAKETGKTIYDTYLCEVQNSDKEQYIRYGTNEKEIQKDFFIIDKEGNVLNDIQWEFERITKINLYPIPNTTMEIKNGNFISNAVEIKSEQEKYYQRNIKVTNSGNVKITGIKHSLRYNDSEEPNGTYYGFLNIAKSANVEINDCELYARKTENKKSTYDLVLTAVVNVECKNIISNDIYEKDRWGITGTNYCKNVVFDECTLNRIDAHRGIYNLTVQDCTLGYKGLRMTGQGELNILRTAICADSIIELRPDYGSTWNGKVNIIDCTYTYDGTTDDENKKVPRLIYAKLHYDNNKLFDFGYECKLPDLNIQNLKIDMQNYDEKPLYLFYIDNVKDGEEYNEKLKKYWPKDININGYTVLNENETNEPHNEVNSDVEFIYRKKNIDYKKFLPFGYNYVISDASIIENGNNIISKIDIDKNYKTNQNLRLEIKQNTSSTNRVNIYKNEEIKANNQLIEGDFSYDFTDTGKYKIEVISTDSFEYEGIKSYEFEIEKTLPELEVIYSTKDLTNEDVTVTVISNKEIQEVEGWTRAEDRKSITKVYTQNGSETVTVKDILGNTATVNVEVNNIDKVAPRLEVIYSTKDLTNEDVTVTIRSNKEIQEVEGWTRAEDRKSITKVYTQNGSETVTVRDLYGNIVTANVDINNIEKNKDNDKKEDIPNETKESKESKKLTESIDTNGAKQQGILPKTGERGVVLIVLLTISILVIAVFIRYRKVKDI